jgi:hypothetical protein
MRGEEIIKIAMKKNLLTTSGKTPHATLTAQLNTGIKEREGFAFGKVQGRFYQRRRESEMICNILVTKEYQTIGMTLFANRYKCIPHEREHRFLTWGCSTIGASVGLGLFVRQGRSIPGGCILCEYVGIVEKPNDDDDDDDNILRPYAVTAGRNTKHPVVINGISPTGEILSLGALANDAGPHFRNAVYTEFWDTYPGRVFLVSTKTLGPGEEIFVEYGCHYWGIASYPDDDVDDIESWARLTHKDAAAMPAYPTNRRMVQCTQCNDYVPERVLQLHLKTDCGDPLATVALENLNSLPENEFTTSIRATCRGAGTQERALCMVDSEDELTANFTHDQGAARQQKDALDPSPCYDSKTTRSIKRCRSSGLSFKGMVEQFLLTSIKQDKVGKQLWERRDEGDVSLEVVWDAREQYTSLAQLWKDIKFIVKWHGSGRVQEEAELPRLLSRCDKEVKKMAELLRETDNEMFL